MPCEVLEEMRAQLEHHRGHEYQPLILFLVYKKKGGREVEKIIRSTGLKPLNEWKK
jgi:hypothetical protein